MATKSADAKKETGKTKRPSFIDKILSLFFGAGGPEADKKRYLKQIAKDLSKARFRFLKPASDEIQPAFAKFFHEFYKAVLPAQAMFNSVQNPNAWERLAVGSVMDEKTLEIFEALSEGAIVELAKKTEVSELKEKVKADLDAFLGVFTSEVCNSVDELYTMILRFKDFCGFDFYLLLKKFDRNIREGDFSYVPKFEPLNGEYALDAIKDIMETAWPLPEIPDWQPMFAALKRVRSIDVVSHNTWSKVVSRVRSLRDSNVLEMMIQLITKNPYYKFTLNVKKEYVIDSYLGKIKSEVERTIQKIETEQKTNKIDNIAEKVFGKTIDELVKNYTASASQSIERKKLGRYEFCQPLNYLKVFLIEHVKADIREFADLVLVRGKWVDRSLFAPMSDAYHALVDLSSKISDFDSSLDDTGVTGNKIRTLVPRADRERGAADIVKNIVTETNTQAKNLIMAGTRDLVTVAKYVKMLLEDYEKPRAELILNWKELAHFIQTPFKQFGTETYKAIYLFIQLIQTFFN
jgi:hypothetical protein